MVEAIKTFFFETFSNPYVAGILISMLPLIELRGGLPYIFFWLTQKLGEAPLAALAKSLLAAFVGSSLICPLLLLFFNPVLRWLKSTKLFRRFGEWLERHFTKKSRKVVEQSANTENPQAEEETESAEIGNTNALQKQDKVKKIKYFALFVFTAIPLPLTGVWTASAVAAILDLDFKKSLFFIVLGNLVAALAISGICWTLDAAVLL